MKKVKAVSPYIYKNGINFKYSAFKGWIDAGGKTASSHYPWRVLHSIAHKVDLPLIKLFQNKNEAHLRFIEPLTINFDVWPDTARYEIIPFFWDCWPQYLDKVCKWLKKHNVKTAIFTSSQTAEKVRTLFPKMNVMYCPEAIDSNHYYKGKELKSRKYDYIEYGRCCKGIDSSKFDKTIKILHSNNMVELKTQEELSRAMADSKITVCMSKFYTSPAVAKDIDTLTQRFWEGLLSRNVIIGHAPKELTDLYGYNPLVEICDNDSVSVNDQLKDILSNIDYYQELVDRNYEQALKLADWSVRMQSVMNYLIKCGYEL